MENVQMSMLDSLQTDVVEKTKGEVIPFELAKKSSRRNSPKEPYKVLPYPISINYGKKGWSIISSLREFISNAMDTKGDYTIQHDGTMAIISDNGKGLSEIDFILGESTRDSSQIGQFGEGLKMALITLLRYCRKVKVATVGFDVVAKKEVVVDKANPSNNAEIMVLDFYHNDKTEGTEIMVECSAKELQEAKDLFLSLKEMTRVDNGIYLPAREVFIKGLSTSFLNESLFSYDIDDKDMTNRDRNIVDQSKLHDNIKRILENSKNQKVITEYLKKFETNPTCYEYQLSLNVKHKDNWRKALDKMYAKAVLSSDLQSDLNARAMGYKVLRNVPFNVLAVLKSLNLKTSFDVAKDYKGQGLFDKNRIVYPISTDYCGQWTRVDAIRELIANALDTDSNISVSYSNGNARISDSGDGIMKKHLIFGISNKTNEAIGQFGEGLKVGSLVLAREGFDVEIQTVGCTYIVKIEKDAEFDIPLLVIYFKKNSKKSGTTIVFNCSESDLEAAKALFSHFKPKRNRITVIDMVEIYPSEPGIIYANGMKTAVVKSLFGYNIKDKKLVASRDRNNVDISAFLGYVQRILPKCTDSAIIEQFLVGWKSNSGLLEYTQTMQLTSKPWLDAAKKVFKKSCIAAYEPLFNLVAKHAGYELLYNVPNCIGNLMQAAKVPSAEDIYKKNKDMGIVREDRVVYPIIPKYCANWTVKDAMRELLSNALDTDTKVTVGHVHDTGFISDKGDGINRKCLLFGATDKSEDQIGQFGEGLKVASLVLARNKRDFNLVTKGYSYKAVIERDQQFNEDVLVFYFEKNRTRKGTNISFKCSNEELESAKSLFIALNKNIKMVDENIYLPEGNIFVNGVYIQKHQTMFGYDIKNKEVLSRDRKTVDMNVASNLISKILGAAKNKTVIEKFISSTGRNNYAEHYMRPVITSSVKPNWVAAVNKMYPKSCFSFNPRYDIAAEEKGYRVLRNLPEGVVYALSQCGIKYSNEVVALKGDEEIVKKRVDKSKLSPEAKAKWKRLMTVFKKLYSKDYDKFEFVEQFNEQHVSRGTDGVYYSRTDMIYVHIDVIEKGTFARLAGVVVHEWVHKVTGYPDNSREFENALTAEIGKFFELYEKKK